MVSAVILAAGEGKRSGVRKQFVRLGNRALLDFSLSVFKILGIDDIVVVLPSDTLMEIEGVKVVAGGPERMDSVFNGVREAKGDFVLVHDSARANLTLDLARRVLESDGDVVIPAVHSPDSVLYNGRYIPRDDVLLIQTPQKVRRDLYLRAYKKAKGKGKVYTDEGSLILEELGIRPTLVEGDRWNFKVTYPEDIDVMRRLKLERYTLFGYDVHRLTAERPLYLAGVKVSDDFGALGHSDGDAILHAVVDALLSFMGYGDIGTLFPDTDDKWKGVRSTVFADKVMDLARRKGMSISRLDVTIILERPKLTSFRNEILKNLSRIFSVPIDKIALKAKSGNGLYPDRVEVLALVEVTTFQC